ncbi:hypothetical protein F7731_01985 [Cytobacillus depressus]|uniref:Helicase Helix-turn-helix domain-containing protein n=1 Tax=Cytobacillus depressus TaxID=1602942 RepID=A0A6L3V9K8_9BACI|nr:helix-turn-helix domain-containing protein [Cytobacillus depressus]KAB2338358.1 hypothetical protein F7731_01985 [Cytobacillus depressus]
MNESYLKMVILYCLHKIDGQRSLYAVLHLLNGKKSAQTIQDAHFFHLTNLFGTFPYLKRKDLDDLADNMKNEGLIKPMLEQSFKLTDLGVNSLNIWAEQQPIPSTLNGWKFHQITNLFWERLSLMVQVISHLQSRDTKYIPIQRKKEVHFWLKEFLQKTSLSREEWGHRLYHELTHCLEKNQEIDPAIMIIRLTGYKRIGLTAKQAAEKLGIEFGLYCIQFISLIHYMLETIQLNSKKYLLLNMLISNEYDLFPLTQSASKTYSLLKKDLNIEEIVQIRRLKRSTIEDHIVEIALNVKNFDISTFVQKEKQQLINEAFKKSSSKQLKHIRQLVPNADYFEIRLTLSRGGKGNEA